MYQIYKALHKLCVSKELINLENVCTMARNYSLQILEKFNTFLVKACHTVRLIFVPIGRPVPAK